MASTCCESKLNRRNCALACIGYFFFLTGGVVGNWSALIPTIMIQHNLDESILGELLVCESLGSIAGAGIVAFLSSRFGSKQVLSVGAILIALLPVVLGAPVESSYFLAFGIFCVGLGVGWVDTSSNDQGILCEKYRGTSLLGFFHCMYACGILTGSLFGGGLMQCGVSPLHEFLAFACLTLLPSLLCRKGLFSFAEGQEINSGALTCKEAGNENTRWDAEGFEEIEVGVAPADLAPDDVSLHLVTNKGPAHETDGPLSARNVTGRLSSHMVSLKTRDAEHVIKAPVSYKHILVISLLALVASCGEVSIGGWSTVYLVVTLNASPIIGVLGLVACQVFVIICRYSLDRLVALTSRKILLCFAGCSACCGLLLVAMAPSAHHNAVIPLAIFGFALAGGGLGLAAPIFIYYAGMTIEGLTSSRAVASISAAAYLGELIGHPLIGNTADDLGGLRWSLLLDGCFMLLIVILAFFLPHPMNMKH